MFSLCIKYIGVRIGSYSVCFSAFVWAAEWLWIRYLLYYCVFLALCIYRVAGCQETTEVSGGICVGLYVVYLLVTLWDEEEADLLVGMRFMGKGRGGSFFSLWDYSLYWINVCLWFNQMRDCVCKCIVHLLSLYIWNRSNVFSCWPFFFLRSTSKAAIIVPYVCPVSIMYRAYMQFLWIVF
jgi:hypothetical protein